jgi:hypothetical protein
VRRVSYLEEEAHKDAPEAKMIIQDEEVRVKSNVEVIQNYLCSEFKGWELADRSEGLFGHLFVVTNLSTYKRHRLKVSGSRLSDRNHTPASIKHLLSLDNVAERMRDPRNQGGFSWGW